MKEIIMKRFFVFLVVLIVICGCTACSAESNTSKTDTQMKLNDSSSDTQTQIEQNYSSSDFGDESTGADNNIKKPDTQINDSFLDFSSIVVGEDNRGASSMEELIEYLSGYRYTPEWFHCMFYDDICSNIYLCRTDIDNHDLIVQIPKMTYGQLSNYCNMYMDKTKLTKISIMPKDPTEYSQYPEDFFEIDEESAEEYYSKTGWKIIQEEWQGITNQWWLTGTFVDVNGEFICGFSTTVFESNGRFFF